VLIILKCLWQMFAPLLVCVARLAGLTAGVTGKGGIWREKPPDAESAVWG